MDLKEINYTSFFQAQYIFGFHFLLLLIKMKRNRGISSIISSNNLLQISTKKLKEEKRELRIENFDKFIKNNVHDEESSCCSHCSGNQSNDNPLEYGIEPVRDGSIF